MKKFSEKDPSKFKPNHKQFENLQYSNSTLNVSETNKSTCPQGLLKNKEQNLKSSDDEQR